ncbi:MAG: TIM barrel protein [Eubacteriales bacterium]|nr:TIM barrel protein [Eubacteriales bacterium]
MISLKTERMEYMKKFIVGLQLYSIREDMEKDMAAALGKVREIGYEYVEFAGYFGHSAEDVKKMLDDNGLKCISVHQKHDVFLKEPAAAISHLRTIGASYCAVPWMGKDKHKGSADFEGTVKEFIQAGKALKDAGIQLLYHNHDFEFERYDGKFLLDWLYESVPADLLKTQIDTCWVRYAGYDPAAYLRKYVGRSPVVHLKDFVCEKFNMGAAYALIDSSGKEGKPADRNAAGFKFMPLGMGMQDFNSILEAAEYAGADIVIVEQDASTDRPPMEAAKISREYLRGSGMA